MSSCRRDGSRPDVEEAKTTSDGLGGTGEQVTLQVLALGSALLNEVRTADGFLHAAHLLEPAFAWKRH
jgi:hypothetical protein